MQNDFPKWNNFVQQMKRQRDRELEGQADKTASRGAQRVREGDKEGGEGDLANEQKKT
jgi:hypothetical protein